MSTVETINDKEEHPKIYYEILLQQQLRKLVEYIDEKKPCRKGRTLCLECYQRNCICLEKTVQGKSYCKKTESRRRIDAMNLNCKCDDDDYDNEFNYYSTLIIPPASLLLRYAWAEKKDEDDMLVEQELMYRMDKISNMNVHAWLEFLGHINKADEVFSGSVYPLDDDNVLKLKNPIIKRPSTETATGDKDEDKKQSEVNIEESKNKNNDPGADNPDENKDENDNPKEVNNADNKDENDNLKVNNEKNKDENDNLLEVNTKETQQ